MDESSKQHIKETRQPIPAKAGTVEKYDTERDAQLFRCKKVA
jgi:hypothetical protein